jgi:hypothetical protein
MMNDDEQRCPGCGMEAEDWKGTGSRGFHAGGELYCCQGCADGSGCTCESGADVSLPAAEEDEDV